MNIDYMREFLVLAEKLNYTTAAEELYISQPTLTRHVNALEDEFGARLFNRSRHNVELTVCGEIARDSFRTIVREADELKEQLDAITRRASETFRLGFGYHGLSVLYGYPLLRSFASRHPEIPVSTISAAPVEIYKYLHQGTIDVALTFSPSDGKSPDTEEQVIDRVKLYAVVLPNHELAARSSVSLEDIARGTVVINPSIVSRSRYIESLFEGHDIRLEHVVRNDDIDFINLTLERTGCVFIGSKAVQTAGNSNLVFVPLEDADDFTYDIVLQTLANNEGERNNLRMLGECLEDIELPCL